MRIQLHRTTVVLLTITLPTGPGLMAVSSVASRLSPYGAETPFSQQAIPPEPEFMWNSRSQPAFGIRRTLLPMESGKIRPNFPMAGSTVPGAEPSTPDVKTRDAFERLRGFLIVDGPLPVKADAMLIFGHDLLPIAAAAAELSKIISVDVVVPTGGKGRLTPSEWTNEATEFAKQLKRIAPELIILPEPHAANTRQNAALGWDIIQRFIHGKHSRHVESIVGIHIPIQSLRAKKMLERVLENSGLPRTEWPELYFHSVIQTGMDVPFPGWSAAFWAQRELFEAMSEIAGLLGYQNPSQRALASIGMPEPLLKDALTIGEYFQGDPSIFPEDKETIGQRMNQIKEHLYNPPPWSPVIGRSSRNDWMTVFEPILTAITALRIGMLPPRDILGSPLLDQAIQNAASLIFPKDDTLLQHIVRELLATFMTDSKNLPSSDIAKAAARARRIGQAILARHSA